MIGIRIVLISLALLLVLGAVGLVVAAPASLACGLDNEADLRRLSDGTLIDSASSVGDESTLVAMRRDGMARIESAFGTMRAKPIVAVLGSIDTLRRWHFNEYASTSFLPWRTCIVIGPKGHSVDVIAHELMHAELIARTGYWQRLVHIPTWFDEGVAMQVDLRTKYVLSDSDRQAGWPAAVRSLVSGRQFFTSDDHGLTRHYAAAKEEVANWLRSVERKQLFLLLDRIGSGENFSTLVPR